MEFRGVKNSLGAECFGNEVDDESKLDPNNCSSETGIETGILLSSCAIRSSLITKHGIITLFSFVPPEKKTKQINHCCFRSTQGKVLGLRGWTKGDHGHEGCDRRLELLDTHSSEKNVDGRRMKKGYIRVGVNRRTDHTSLALRQSPKVMTIKRSKLPLWQGLVHIKAERICLQELACF